MEVHDHGDCCVVCDCDKHNFSIVFTECVCAVMLGIVSFLPSLVVCFNNKASCTSEMLK